MFLDFSIWDIIQVPFGYLLDFLYRLTTSYGWALILFSIIVKTVLLPTTIKSKRSTMKMSRLTPKIQYLQKKYEGDQQKQTAAIQALYKQEGVSMGGGCLWSLLPLLILIPLYTVIREPITYILHEDATVTGGIMSAVMGTAENPGLLSHLITANSPYAQLIAAAHLDEIALELKTLVPEISERTLAGLDFTFLGIDLSMEPEFNVFNSDIWAWDWQHIGAFLLPILSAASQLVTMIISRNVNNSLVTDSKGIQDKDAAKESQSNKSGKVMTYLFPVMTIFIGFSMPAAMSLYWLIQSVVGAVMDHFLTKKLRKEYDAEDAIRQQKAWEEEQAELEKERIRAERREANPDGITANTSKKKLQQQQQKEQEAAKAAAKREYNAKRGIVEEEKPVKEAMSGVADRPFCKGRNYDPSRFASDTTEE